MDGLQGAFQVEQVNLLQMGALRPHTQQLLPYIEKVFLVNPVLLC